jgi:DNA-binding NtrC family response regulator
MKPKLLVVDDEIINLENFKLIFEDDFEIETATCAKQALRLLENNPDIGVILSDNRMPGISGAEMLQQVARIRPKAIRIIITGFPEDIDSKTRANLFEVIAKPYEYDEIVKVLDRACVVFASPA